MSPDSPFPLIAVDVGNSRLKFGRFDTADGQALPRPTSTFDLAPGGSFDEVFAWLSEDQPQDFAWRIGSVNRRGATRLVDWLRQHGATTQTTLLASFDLPLSIRLERPDAVGMDRLLSAVAANRLRPPQRPAIVVDLGTAVTVDLISAEGEFLGGAILPGIGMSARAMHEFTDLLPRIDMSALGEPPAALGKTTVEAMTSGLYWGAVGGARCLIENYRKTLDMDPQVILTGGAASCVAGLLSESALFEPHLTLAGIALAVTP